MRKKLLILFAIVIPVVAFAQDKKQFGIKFSGFVKNDFFFDSRETVSIREGHYFLYPASEKLDKNGDDLNAKSSFNFLSIQTRLRVVITGPDAFGAITSGVIEGAFFGHSNDDINGFRLRHAFVKLKWEKAELLFGQYWHPMFITSCFPDVVSFNTGVPFQPFSRNPQIRLTRNFGKVNLVVVANSQRDFTSTGPEGKGSLYLRNSSMPELNVQLHYSSKNKETGNEILMGIGGEYKVLTPRLATDSNVIADESISSMAAIAYFVHKCKKRTFKLECVYGENLYDLIMLGGYALKYQENEDWKVEDNRDYVNLNTLSIWTDVHSNGKKLQVGLFAGYTKNMGSNENIQDWENADSYYARGHNLEFVYRVAPRVIFNSGKARFATELEYTTAAYASEWNSLNEIQKSETVSNIRLLFAVYYFF